MATMTETFSFVLIYPKGIFMMLRKEAGGYIELSGDRKRRFTLKCVCVHLYSHLFESFRPWE